MFNFVEKQNQRFILMKMKSQFDNVISTVTARKICSGGISFSIISFTSMTSKQSCRVIKNNQLAFITNGNKDA